MSTSKSGNRGGGSAGADQPAANIAHEEELHDTTDASHMLNHAAAAAAAAANNDDESNAPKVPHKTPVSVHSNEIRPASKV
jgi:hypothetical protein